MYIDICVHMCSALDWEGKNKRISVDFLKRLLATGALFLDRYEHRHIF